MKTYIAHRINDAEYQLELIYLVYNKHGIKFRKTKAAKLVGGEYRLEKLVMAGEIRVDKPPNRTASGFATPQM